MACCSILTLLGFSLLNPIVAFAASVQNASPRADVPIIKTNVRQVLVPVVVTDKSGHYVSDLGREDFTVFEVASSSSL